ncbi:MAG: DUF5666 domain-containing protein [Burkholderiales bacterium]
MRTPDVLIRNALVLSVAAFLAACGGSSGSDSAASTSPGTSPQTSATTASLSTVVGSVTGFGSIVVDSVHYDDSSASVIRAKSGGVLANSDARLGQRVILTLDSRGAATKVEVLPELEGAVASIDAALSRFVVNGLTVAVNADAAAGPLTVFGGGYTNFSDIKASDQVEIHGLTKADTAQGAAANTYVVQATRIEKQSDTLIELRAGGYIQNLAVASGKTTFTLGALTVDATTSVLKPSGSTLVNGQYVSVQTSQTITGNLMSASSIRIVDRKKDSTPNETVRIASKISAIDTAASTFVLDGVTVSSKSASLSPKGATMTVGVYARATGLFDANGVLQATDIKLRDESAPQVEIRGTVAKFTSLTDFTVRGVPVDGSAAKLSSCPTSGLAEGQLIQVHGSITLTSPKVKASEIECIGAQSTVDGETLDRKGLASSINAVTKTFVLTPRQGSAVTVNWTDKTFFGKQLSSSALSGMRLEVEGTFAADGSLLARKISLED